MPSITKSGLSYKNCSIGPSTTVEVETGKGSWSAKSRSSSPSIGQSSSWSKSLLEAWCTPQDLVLPYAIEVKTIYHTLYCTQCCIQCQCFIQYSEYDLWSKIYDIKTFYSIQKKKRPYWAWYWCLIQKDPLCHLVLGPILNVFFNIEYKNLWYWGWWCKKTSLPPDIKVFYSLFYIRYDIEGQNFIYWHQVYFLQILTNSPRTSNLLISYIDIRYNMNIWHRVQFPAYHCYQPRSWHPPGSEWYCDSEISSWSREAALCIMCIESL